MHEALLLSSHSCCAGVLIREGVHALVSRFYLLWRNRCRPEVSDIHNSAEMHPARGTAFPGSRFVFSQSRLEASDIVIKYRL